MSCIYYEIYIEYYKPRGLPEVQMRSGAICRENPKLK